MKYLSGLSFAAALGASLLTSVALGGAAQAATFAPVAEAVQAGALPAEQTQFRGVRGGGGRAIAGRGVGRGVAAGGFRGARGVRGGRGYYRGGGGAGLAAGLAGAAIIGGIIAAEQERNAYYYGAPGYYGAPVYEEEVYVPRRAYRRYNTNRTVIPYNAIRDPAGGGLTSGGP